MIDRRAWRSLGSAATFVVVLSLAVLFGVMLASAPPPPGPSPASAVPAGQGSPPPYAVTPTPPGATAAAGSLPADVSGSSTPLAPIPAFGHVFIVVMENREYGSIIGNASAPYINSLATRYGLATGYTAVAHPSEPNYLALWSGSTQGVTDDGRHDFTTGTTLADQVEASGRSWHVAAENVPPGCYLGSSAYGGADGDGWYARKHEPAISWTSVSQDAARCARITDFSHFDPNLGDLWLVVPNLCHDMHDCSIATGDAFLERFLPTILDSPAFTDGVVFLTWDEGTSSIGGGGHVPLIAISPLVKPGFDSSTPHSHYSLLRTIETAWGLPCLADACSASDLREVFR